MKIYTYSRKYKDVVCICSNGPSEVIYWSQKEKDDYKKNIQ